jgi:hypothetical protein
MDFNLVQWWTYNLFRNWFQGGDVLIKTMQNNFASYELKVLHYGLLNVEKI